jgi:hypothetical protein
MIRKDCGRSSILRRNLSEGRAIGAWLGAIDDYEPGFEVL